MSSMIMTISHEHAHDADDDAHDGGENDKGDDSEDGS